MKDKIKFKSYFIKDEELNSVNEDMLSTKDVANSISLAINNTKPPFAIAVTGKSGIGKSSVINMVTDMYDGKVDECNIQKINVWKDETSIKEVLEESCITKKSIIENARKSNSYYRDSENLGDEVNKDKEMNSLGDEDNAVGNAGSFNDAGTEKQYGKKKINRVLKAILSTIRLIITFIACFIITTIIFIIMEYLENKEIYDVNDIFFVENTYLNYRENLLLIFIFAFGLTAIAYIVNTLKITAQRLKADKNAVDASRNYNSVAESINNEIQSSVKENVDKMSEDGDENGFHESDEIDEVIIEDIDSNDYDSAERYTRNIIIVEDIDKLGLSKMLKTLEEIKYCAEYENCILIVPFDEKVLARAISARNQLKLGANYRPLNFERIVDKIFEFKFQVPYISNDDMKRYAIELVGKTIPDFIKEYTNMRMFDRVIKNVLVYKNVRTPRHVKKLINCFVNNKVLISQRLVNGNIDRNFNNGRNYDLQLAKLSVLQSDFPDFYEVLFENPGYLDELTELYCTDAEELRNIYDSIDEGLKPFISNKYRALVNFLRQTKNYKIDNISTLMYLSKTRTERMYKNRSVLSYILGNEDILKLKHEEVLELIGTMDNKDDLTEFSNNNFSKLFEEYKQNVSDKDYFKYFSKVVEAMYDVIDEESYTSYLEIVADNYNSYPQEALAVLGNLKIDMPVSVINILIVRMEETISKENYDEVFEFLRDNSDPFYEENGNVSSYVQFLVEYIGLASDPTSVIVELDENFTRIGKVYELNRNIKGLANLDYDVAYKFLAKCLDNGDLDRMVTVINTILSDDNSVEDCLSIEEKMSNYNLVDVVECDVDDMNLADKLSLKKANNGTNAVDKSMSAGDKDGNNDDAESDVDNEANGNDDDSVEAEDYNDEEEANASALENAKLLDGNYTLLRNIIEICANKQENIEPVDTMKIIEKALQNVGDKKYILGIYELLNKFDRMYFYEIRRAFNEVIYGNFHAVKDDKIRKASLECTRYFKNTRLFITKLTKDEKKFYDKN